MDVAKIIKVILGGLWKVVVGIVYIIMWTVKGIVWALKGLKEK